MPKSKAEQFLRELSEKELIDHLAYNLDRYSFIDVSEEYKLHCIKVNPYSVLYMEKPSSVCQALALVYNQHIIKSFSYDYYSYEFLNMLDICFKTADNLNHERYSADYVYIMLKSVMQKNFDDTTTLTRTYNHFLNWKKEKFKFEHGADSFGVAYEMMRKYEMALKKIDNYHAYEIVAKRNEGIEIDYKDDETDLNMQFLKIAGDVLHEGKDNN